MASSDLGTAHTCKREDLEDHLLGDNSSEDWRGDAHWTDDGLDEDKYEELEDNNKYDGEWEDDTGNGDFEGDAEEGDFEDDVDIVEY